MHVAGEFEFVCGIPVIILQITYFALHSIQGEFTRSEKES